MRCRELHPTTTLTTPNFEMAPMRKGEALSRDISNIEFCQFVAPTTCVTLQTYFANK